MSGASDFYAARRAGVRGVSSSGRILTKEDEKKKPKRKPFNVSIPKQQSLPMSSRFNDSNNYPGTPFKMPTGYSKVSGTPFVTKSPARKEKISSRFNQQELRALDKKFNRPATSYSGNIAPSKRSLPTTKQRALQTEVRMFNADAKRFGNSKITSNIRPQDMSYLKIKKEKLTNKARATGMSVKETPSGTLQLDKLKFGDAPKLGPRQITAYPKPDTGTRLLPDKRPTMAQPLQNNPYLGNLDTSKLTAPSVAKTPGMETLSVTQEYNIGTPRKQKVTLTDDQRDYRTTKSGDTFYVENKFTGKPTRISGTEYMLLNQPSSSFIPATSKALKDENLGTQIFEEDIRAGINPYVTYLAYTGTGGPKSGIVGDVKRFATGLKAGGLTGFKQAVKGLVSPESFTKVDQLGAGAGATQIVANLPATIGSAIRFKDYIGTSEKAGLKLGEVTASKEQQEIIKDKDNFKTIVQAGYGSRMKDLEKYNMPISIPFIGKNIPQWAYNVEGAPLLSNVFDNIDGKNSFREGAKQQALNLGYSEKDAEVAADAAIRQMKFGQAAALPLGLINEVRSEISGKTAAEGLYGNLPVKTGFKGFSDAALRVAPITGAQGIGEGVTGTELSGVSRYRDVSTEDLVKGGLAGGALAGVIGGTVGGAYASGQNTLGTSTLTSARVIDPFEYPGDLIGGWMTDYKAPWYTGFGTPTMSTTPPSSGIPEIEPAGSFKGGTEKAKIQQTAPEVPPQMQMPSELPSDIPEENILTDSIPNTPIQNTMSSSSSTILPVDQPTDVSPPVDQPTDVSPPVDVPVDVPIDVSPPVDVPVDVPIDVSPPVDVPVDVSPPVDQPTDVPITVIDKGAWPFGGVGSLPGSQPGWMMPGGILGWDTANPIRDLAGEWLAKLKAKEMYYIVITQQANGSYLFQVFDKKTNTVIQQKITNNLNDKNKAIEYIKKIYGDIQITER